MANSHLPCITHKNAGNIADSEAKIHPPQTSQISYLRSDDQRTSFRMPSHRRIVRLYPSPDSNSFRDDTRVNGDSLRRSFRSTVRTHSLVPHRHLYSPLLSVSIGPDPIVELAFCRRAISTFPLISSLSLDTIFSPPPHLQTVNESSSFNHLPPSFHTHVTTHVAICVAHSEYYGDL